MKGRACMGVMGGSDDHDATQMLVLMQVAIREIGTNVVNNGKRLDEVIHSIRGMEQSVSKVQQNQVVTKTEPAPTLVELDNMMKKNFEHLPISPRPNGDDVSQQQLLAARHSQLMHRVEEGFGEVLHRMTSKQGAVGPESKAGPPKDNVLSEMRSDLVAFQSALMNEFRTQKESLLHEFQQLGKRDVPLGRENTLDDLKRSVNQLTHDLRSELAQQPRGPSEVNMDDWRSHQLQAQPFPQQNLAYPAGDRGNPQPEDGIQQQQFAPIPILQPAPIGKSEEDPKKQNETEREKQDEEELEMVDVEAAEAEELDGMVPSLREGDGMGACFSSDDDVEAPQYHVEDYYKTTGCSQSIARSDRFANFTVFVVALNAIYIGVDSDWNSAQNIYHAHLFFQICSQLFCMYFTFEWTARALAFRHIGEGFRDGWFKFDTFLVSTMILDLWVLMPILYVIGGKVQIPTQPLRMLRLFKLTRMARLMKAFPELVTMIKGLVRSLRAISSSMILIGLMVYVWGIMMHMLMKNEVQYNNLMWEGSQLGFETLTKCIWTLLIAGTLMLDNTSPLLKSMLFADQLHYKLAGFCFLSYGLLSSMLILQMLIGVLCDVVSRVGGEQRDASAIGLVKQELLENLRKYDNGDGKISQKELLQVMCEPKSRAVLKKLNINRAFVLELQKMMFTHPGQQVPIKAVLQVMILCQGSNNATVESMSGGILSVIHELSALRRQLERDLHDLQRGVEVHVDRAMTNKSPDNVNLSSY